VVLFVVDGDTVVVLFVVVGLGVAGDIVVVLFVVVG
jgi:hypothetical protein